MRVDVCNAEECKTLWDKKKVSNKESLSLTHGKDFYIRVSAEDVPELSLASRVMARTSTQDWTEVAAFFSYAPEDRFLSLRSEADFSKLCPNAGKCRLDFQLRPSLRMGRRDARIKRYWGATVELGSLTLDVRNAATRAIWSSFAQKLEK